MRRLGGWLVAVAIFAAAMRPVPAMTEKQLMDTYLATVEEAVDVFEPLWVEGDVPGAGHFDFQGYNNWQGKGYAALVTTPGNGQIIFCYALLLNETDKKTFGKMNVPRETLREHTLKAIRWIVMTSGYVPGHVKYPIPNLGAGSMKDGGFARRLNQSYDSHGWFTLGAAMLWKEIDQDTKDKMEFLFKGMAEQTREPGYWGTFSGGHPDRVKQNESSTIGAAWLLKSAEDMVKYREIIEGNAISAVGTEHDFASSAIVAGRPMNQWAMDWNLYPDYSSDHHWWAQIWYGCDEVFEGYCFLETMARVTKTKVPEAITWPDNGYKGVAAWARALVTPEGEPASVHGMEYDSYYGAGLLPFAYGATVGKDPVSAALEQQAAVLLRKHTQAVRQYDHHRDSWAKAASAYLLHKYEGPGAEAMPLPEAMAALRGTWHYKWQNNLLQRTGDKFVSFSWGSMLQQGARDDMRYPRGWVIPARGWKTGVEPLVYMHQETLLGKMTVKGEGGKPVRFGEPITVYREQRDDQVFNTTGEAADGWLARRGAFHSFEQGPAVWLLSVEALKGANYDWTGMPIHFYARPGVTETRTYSDAQGSAALETTATRTSSWWSVGDRLGIATLGLGDHVDIHREPGLNWARTNEYKDKVDVVSVGGFKAKPLKTGENLVDASVVIYPDAKADQIKAAQARLEKEGKLALPEGWRGVVAPDAIRPGVRHLALTRLHGVAGIATLRLSFEEGAPVLGIPAVIEEKTAHVNVALDAMHSLSESFDLYINSSDDVNAYRVALGRWRIEPVDESAVKLELRWPEPMSGVSGRWVPDKGTPEDLDLGKAEQGVSLKINGAGTLELKGGRYEDKVAPAVEITNYNNREDGRVTLTVTANDRSGIASVELVCDGKPVQKLAALPWEFTYFPGEGLHTWQAVATDKAGNKRESVKRTFEVKIADIGMNTGQ
ncbi:Ig-like domain-containing protein [bacterium]|nr:Ig-like domain-containing protein [bacterium]